MKVKSALLSLVLVAFLSFPLFSQEQKAEAKKESQYGWQKEMIGGLNLTQTNLSNWAQGGVNSFAWQLNMNFKFVNDQKKSNWAHSGKLTYGAIKIKDQEFRKSIDEIKLESVFTYKVGTHINPFLAVTGETQFSPGYNYATEPKTQISDFMDPAYFRESVGIGFVPDKIIKTRLGLALKQTITRNYPVPYADNPETVDKIEKFKNEAGLESVTDISLNVAKNALFTSKIELFYAFGTFDETDVNWDNTLLFKLSKYVNVNFNFKLFYDKDISSKRQIKQSIALGLTYSFF